MYIQFNKQSVYGKIYVSEAGPDILGWHHQGCLKMILRPGCSPQVILTDTDSDISTQVITVRPDVDLEHLITEFSTLF